MLGSGFSLKCSDLEAVTSPLKLLITEYSENFECNVQEETHAAYSGKGVKSAFGPSGPSGRSLSQFL